MSFSLTLKRTILTSGSTLINGGLGALFFFLLARFLGESDYGVFSLLIISITLLVGVADFGTDQGIIKFVSAKSKSLQYHSFAKLALIIKLLSSVIFAFVLFSFSQTALNIFFPHISQPLLLVFLAIGVFSQLLFSFTTSMAQSKQQFLLWSGLLIGTNLSRFVLLLILLALGRLNIYSASLLYVLFPLVGFLFFLVRESPQFLSAKITHSQVKQFLSFNIWLVLVTVLSTIASRLDILFTARYLPLSVVGIYGLVSQITIVLPQLTSALGAVTAPKFAALSSPSKNHQFSSQTLHLSVALAAVALLLLFLIGYGVLFFSGSGFLAGVVPLIILLFANAIFYALTPIRDSLLFFHGQPWLFVVVSILQILLLLILSPWLIPTLNITGSALLVLIHTLLASLIYIFAYLYYTKNIHE